MPTICPNCLRPVRLDAKYCGFCGSNLYPTAHDDTTAAVISPQVSESTGEKQTTYSELKPKRKQLRRIVLIILVILLCLVLISAFLVNFWPIISH